MARRTYRLLTATLLALSMVVVSVSAATTMLDPFTQEELDDNWEADRQFPSGGVESVSFDGRDNVAMISIVGADQATNPFSFFEGIKKVDDFGLAVQVELYVDADWQNHSPVNVGFWVTVDDPPTIFPSIYYRNGDTVDAGFYTWDGGYIPSGVAVVYDGWNTLSITLDTENGVIHYAINGEDAGSVSAPGDTIGQVFLNHYNAGDRDYDANWHAGVVAATDDPTDDPTDDASDDPTDEATDEATDDATDDATEDTGDLTPVVAPTRIDTGAGGAAPGGPGMWMVIVGALLVAAETARRATQHHTRAYVM